jgi:hypothetical protein
VESPLRVGLASRALLVIEIVDAGIRALLPVQAVLQLNVGYEVAAEVLACEVFAVGVV